MGTSIAAMDANSLSPLPLPQRQLGLCLAGAVSGGAYTAGVLDFIVQALDAFEAARAAGQAPQHRLLVTRISGASAGAMCASILTLAAPYRWPHGAQADGSNPLHDAWVHATDITDLLGDGDARLGAVSSMLDPSSTNAVGARLMALGRGSPPVRAPG